MSTQARSIPVPQETQLDKIALKDLNLIFAGNARFTIRSKSTGVRFTYRIKHAEAEGPYKAKYFVSLLSGPDNENSYTYMGMVTEDRSAYLHDRKNRIKESAPSVAAFKWFFQHLTAGRESNILNQADIFHEGRCCRCGRVLTVPESIESGIGPECASKLQ